MISETPNCYLQTERSSVARDTQFKCISHLPNYSFLRTKHIPILEVSRMLHHLRNLNRLLEPNEDNINCPSRFLASGQAVDISTQPLKLFETPPTTRYPSFPKLSRVLQSPFLKRGQLFGASAAFQVLVLAPISPTLVQIPFTP